MTSRQFFGECFALFCAVMLGLAAGAIWLLPSLFLHRPLPWLAIPVAWVLAAAMCQWVHRRALNAAVLAVVATLVAMLYVHVLTAATTLWEMTAGYGLIGVIRAAGLSTLLDLARIGFNPPRDIPCGAVALVVAVIAAMRCSRAARQPAR